MTGRGVYDTPLDDVAARQAPVEVAAELAGSLRVDYPVLDDRAVAYLEWRAARDDEDEE